MSDPAAVLLGITFFSGVTLSIRAIANAVIRMHETKLKYMHGGASSAQDARLERIEQAVDAIAIEVERISEGQRFTTKLLSEKSASTL